MERIKRNLERWRIDGKRPALDADVPVVDGQGRGGADRRADRAMRRGVIGAARVEVGRGVAVLAAPVDVVAALESGVEPRNGLRREEEDRDDPGAPVSEFHDVHRDYLQSPDNSTTEAGSRKLISEAGSRA